MPTIESDECGPLNTAIGFVFRIQPFCSSFLHMLSLMSRFSPAILGIVLLSFAMFATASLAAQDVLDEWKQRQQKIRQVIKNVGPCVVAIEGGCGVIVSEQGHVLSVAHVTGAAQRRVNVRLADGTVVMGTTLGSDRKMDVGLLKLDEDRKWPHVDVSGLLIPAPRNDDLFRPKLNLAATRVVSGKRPAKELNAAAQTGDWCLAFGYPLSFSRGRPPVVRLGRVSSSSSDHITTSAVMMGGDSGGPLVDLEGRLIGIGSRVKTSIDANIHVPISAYQDRWQQLLAGVDVAKEQKPQQVAQASAQPWLGIFGDTDESRVRVRRVHLGSPADEAGLKPEDVIVSFNNSEVSSFAEVVKLLKRMRPGDKVAIRVNRYGTVIDLSAVLRSNQ